MQEHAVRFPASIDFDSLVKVKEGLQSRRLYHDTAIYELEMERIFGRCWLFLAQDNLIPNIGDYLVTMMGEDEVLVVRQRDGAVKAFLNHCMHRGARVAVAEAGNARGFTCSFHGWGYGLDGALQVVPLEKEVFGSSFDKCKLGLREIRVENYHGFYFGNFDPDAPSYREYLGDLAWYYDAWFEASGGMDLIGPPARQLLNTNWKVPAENFVGDAYHAPSTHSNAFYAAGTAPFPGGQQITTRYGHGATILYEYGHTGHPEPLRSRLKKWIVQRESVIAERLGELRGKLSLGHVNTTVLPNTSMLIGSSEFKVWRPRGPGECEFVTYPIVDKTMPEDLKQELAQSVHRMFGASGMIDTEDADNFESVYGTNRGRQARKGWMTTPVGQGFDRELPGEPGVHSVSPISELNHRGFYRAYKDFMECENWEQIKVRSEAWKEQILGPKNAQKDE